MHFSPLIDQLMESLRCLPGVGPKSAQRMALHLLERDRRGAEHLAQALSQAMTSVGRCLRCGNFSEEEECRICRHHERDRTLLCIVESPADVLAIEQAGSYNGLYFVLMGHLSPIDGVGPEELGLDRLLERVDGDVREVILATNPTVEGEATAHYIADQLSGCEQVVVTRIAHGVPVGGELEFVDGGTLAHALHGRRTLETQ